MRGSNGISAGEDRRRVWRVALRAGSCLALGVGLVSVPGNPLPPEQRGAMQVLVLDHPQLATRTKPTSAPARPVPAEVVPPAVAPQPPVQTVVASITPAPTLGAVAVAAVPVAALRLPDKSLPVAPDPVAPAAVAVPPLRAVDIAQVTDKFEQSLYVPQLQERGLVAGVGGTLVAKVDAMQVPAPPRLTGEERAALLEAAPSEMTVRIGADAVGAVAFRMSETGSIDVQLSGLLDLVGGRMAPEEFSRLRSSSAAGTYVPLDQLRTIGLSVRYDAVYDELELSA